ncbi:Hypothetical protein, putative [Bodo saltans]|uniref:Uncharacterized protein n=1 Tax=Bodo saltans TaxID=75058 RepID=A0A0S4IZF4_BODSA|nr:Hypothetical protein, putative [Bodo saltans]|eukprot:CUG66604.1 Hypothetical protein, putative [Bodo saltans]
MHSINNTSPSKQNDAVVSMSPTPSPSTLSATPPPPQIQPSHSASSLALITLHRSLSEACRRSYRWNAVPQGDAANHLRVCLLRRVITLLRRVAHTTEPASTRNASTKALTRAQHNATLAAVVSSSIRPLALTDADEFKMLMLESLSVVFHANSMSSVFYCEQTLVDAVNGLAADNIALEDLVQASLVDLNSVGGNFTAGASDFDVADELSVPQQQQQQHHFSSTTRQRAAFLSSPFLPTSPPEGVSMNSSAALQQQHLNSSNDRMLNGSASQLFGVSRPGGYSGRYSVATGATRTRISPYNGSKLLAMLSPSSFGKLWSRQTLVMMLFVLVVVSLSTSLHAWRDLRRNNGSPTDVTSFTFAPRRERHREMPREYEEEGAAVVPPIVVGGDEGNPDGNNYEEQHQALEVVFATPNPLPPRPQRDIAEDAAHPRISRKRAAELSEAKKQQQPEERKVKVDTVLEELKKREQDLLDSLQRERALIAALNGEQQPVSTSSPPTSTIAASNTAAPAPPLPFIAPTVANPCGADSTKNPSGLPGRSYDPVDSITALSFDLTDEDLGIISKLETAKLATRHTFIRDLIARAMDADPRDERSSYHMFFQDRHARMEMVDAQDELALIPLSDESAFLANNSDEKVLLRHRIPGTACPAIQPALVDAVYTYVNPNSASHKTAVKDSCKARGRECSDHRFRDFNELMYSLRSVHHRGGMHSNEGNDERKQQQNSGRFVGNVYIVVADRDQIPGWLRHEHVPLTDEEKNQRENLNKALGGDTMRQESRVYSVTHKEIFPPEVHVFFRPISHARQQYRIETTVEGQCLAEHFRSDESPVVGAESPTEALKPLAAKSRRAVVFMEPIHYFEKLGEAADRRMTPKYDPIPQKAPVVISQVRQRVIRTGRGQALIPVPLVQQPASTPTPPPPPPPESTYIASIVSNEQNNASCAFTPAKADAIFKLTMKTPRASDLLHKTTNYNRKLLFTYYGLPPSHSFAHYPGIYDRSVLSRMMDEELKEDVATTRAARIRTQDSIWTTMVYPYVAFAHRRAVDRRLVAETLNLWTRFTTYTELSKDVGRLGPLMDLNFGALPEEYQGEMWLTDDAANAAHLRPLSATLGKFGHAIAKEKLRDWVVTMDNKDEAIYHFCMMTTGAIVSKYHRELQTKMKLFVTANDDLKIVSPISVDAVEALMMLVSGGAPPAPWER